MLWQTKKKLWFAFLQYSLYCNGLEPNPQYLLGMLVCQWRNWVRTSKEVIYWDLPEVEVIPTFYWSHIKSFWYHLVILPFCLLSLWYMLEFSSYLLPKFVPSCLSYSHTCIDDRHLNRFNERGPFIKIAQLGKIYFAVEILGFPIILSVLSWTETPRFNNKDNTFKHPGIVAIDVKNLNV